LTYHTTTFVIDCPRETDAQIFELGELQICADPHRATVAAEPTSPLQRLVVQHDQHCCKDTKDAEVGMYISSFGIRLLMLAPDAAAGWLLRDASEPESTESLSFLLQFGLAEEYWEEYFLMHLGESWDRRCWLKDKLISLRNTLTRRERAMTCLYSLFFIYFIFKLGQG